MNNDAIYSKFKPNNFVYTLSKYSVCAGYAFIGYKKVQLIKSANSPVDQKYAEATMNTLANPSINADAEKTVSLAFRRFLITK